MTALILANINIPLLSAVAAFFAALAAAAANIQKIAIFVAKIVSWLSAKRLDQPILLSLQIFRVEHDRKIPQKFITESGSSLLDITISYDGRGKIVFDHIDVQHSASLLTSIATGQLKSKAKYKFRFKYDSVITQPLLPPLVIDPDSESLLRFEVELAPEGIFPTTGGAVYARLRYQNNSGRVGVLPLFPLRPEDYRDYPDLYEKITRQHEFLFPVFGGSSARDKLELFKLTRNNLIRGKPKKRAEFIALR
jgi:hypothetical protein